MKDRAGMEPLFVRLSYNLKEALRVSAGEEGTTMSHYVVEAIVHRLNASRPAPVWSHKVRELEGRIEALENAH